MYSKYLGSSVDQTQLSATIKSLIPLAALLLVKFGFDIGETELDNLATTTLLAVNACVTAYYAARRIYLKLIK
jgi:hypothetical protein